MSFNKKELIEIESQISKNNLSAISLDDGEYDFLEE